MEFAILGPLEVRREGHPVALGGGKPRALLAALLLEANQPLSADRLAVALWGEDAPAASVRTVQVHLSRLRRALAERDRITTTAAGYRLLVRPDELDLERFRRLLAGGRAALAANDPARAAAQLREALSLWRGPALADLADELFAQAEIAQLEEQRLEALEARIDADLAVGAHAALVGELARLVDEHPLRERLHAQRILALYRGGRQADALAAYHSARQTLIEQLGVEPGRALQELQRAVLEHDARLDLPAGRGGVRPLRAGDLPVAPRLFGRDDDLTRLTGLLQHAARRLVTLVGPGGVGKTSLAMAAAGRLSGEFRDGARCVPLAASGDLAAALLTGLELASTDAEAPLATLSRFLGGRELLLVLDNVEHLLAAAPLVAELLAACPELRVLATSREPLRLGGEQVYHVDPLPVPSGGDLARAPAVALFAERARAHDSRFVLDSATLPHVVEICRRLDGLPLALELAAARVSLLTPAELAGRLDQALGVLGAGARDAPARQRTLRATLDWSDAMLGEAERHAFAACGAFAGGAPIVACETIADASLDTLQSLVDRSLVFRRGQRLGMLEPVRQYAAERLSALADEADIRGRHARWCLGLAAGSDAALRGPERAERLRVLDTEHENVRAALRWGFEQGQPALAAELAIAMAPYWYARARGREGLQWVDRALQTLASVPPRLLLARAMLRHAVDDFAGAGGSAAAAAEGFAAEGDDLGRARALLTRAAAECMVEDWRNARGHAEAAAEVARSAGDAHLEAEALELIAQTLPAFVARPLVERAAAGYRRAGDQRALAELLAGSAFGELIDGDTAIAVRLAADAARIEHGLDDALLRCFIRGNEGLAALFDGRLPDARRAFEQELALSLELALKLNAAEGLMGLAAVAARAGDVDRAARLWGGGLAQEPTCTAIIPRLECEFFAAARAAAGAERWDAACREGRALPLQAAIELAFDAGARTTTVQSMR